MHSDSPFISDVLSALWTTVEERRFSAASEIVIGNGLQALRATGAKAHQLCHGLRGPEGPLFHGSHAEFIRPIAQSACSSLFHGSSRFHGCSRVHGCSRFWDRIRTSQFGPRSLINSFSVHPAPAGASAGARRLHQRWRWRWPEPNRSAGTPLRPPRADLCDPIEPFPAQEHR